jgi:hypothetical protein
LPIEHAAADGARLVADPMLCAEAVEAFVGAFGASNSLDFSIQLAENEGTTHFNASE